jgi:PAS domain S-box-containing protein
MAARLAPLYSAYLRFWRRLNQPLQKIADQQEMLNAQRTSVSLGWLCAAGLFVSAFLLVPWGTSSRILLGVWVTTLALLAIFVLNLSGGHRLAPRLVVVTLSVAIVGIWLTDIRQPAPQILNYLILVTFISSRLLPLREMISSTLLNIGVLIALHALLPQAQNMGAAIIFNASMGTAVTIITLSRLRDMARVESSERRVRALMEAYYEPLMILDRKGNILDCNTAFESFSGYQTDKVHGLNIRTMVTPQSAAYLDKVWGTPASTVVRLDALLASGATVPVQVFSRLHTYDDKPALVVLVRSLLYETAIERQKKEYERRYKALYENSHDGIFILRMDGSYMSANRRGLEMMGVSSEEFITASYLDFVPPEERDKSEATMEKLKAGEVLPIYMRTFRRRNGETFPAEVSAMLVHDEQGEPLYIQSIVRDVSERQRIEQNRLQLRVQQERNKLLKQLIDDFSHHVRTPLSNIKNGSYLMYRYYDHPEKRQQQLQVVDSEVERLVFLTDDLLTLTRLEPEQEANTVTTVRLDALVRQILPAPLGTAPEDPAHHWHYDCDEDIPPILGNEPRLMEMFRRLFSNAHHYTPAGGKIDVRVVFHPQKEATAVSVIDTGIGIAPEDLPLIFDNFYRSDNARNLRPSSSGLGLSICRKIAEMHKGIIHVESTLGVGTHVQVWLPCNPGVTLDYDTLGLNHNTEGV